MKKFDRGLVASGASTTSGVRLLAASTIPVRALVKPGPWCTDSAVSRPDTRANPSAMLAAPPSCAARHEPGSGCDHRVGDVEVAAADHAEHVVHAVRYQGAADRLGDLHCPLDERERAARTAGAAHDRQRTDEHHRAARRQLRQVLQLRQPVLVVTEQERVTRKRRIERVRGSGIGADRLDADPQNRRRLGQPLRALHRDPRRVPGIQECILVV